MFWTSFQGGVWNMGKFMKWDWKRTPKIRRKEENRRKRPFWFGPENRHPEESPLLSCWSDHFTLVLGFFVPLKSCLLLRVMHCSSRQLWRFVWKWKWPKKAEIQKIGKHRVIKTRLLARLREKTIFSDGSKTLETFQRPCERIISFPLSMWTTRSLIIELKSFGCRASDARTKPVRRQRLLSSPLHLSPSWPWPGTDSRAWSSCKCRPCWTCN